MAGFFTEDFTTWTEHDDGNKITIVDPQTISIADVATTENHYLSKDYGIDYFSGNWTHQFYITTPNSSATMYYWLLTNVEGDTTVAVGTSNGAVKLYLYYGRLYIQTSLGGYNSASAGSWVYARNTTYHVTLDFDYDAGSSSNGLLVLTIRSGGPDSTVVFTANLNFRSQDIRDYRYLEVMPSTGEVASTAYAGAGISDLIVGAGTTDITLNGAVQALSIAQPAGGAYIEQGATVAGALQVISLAQPAGVVYIEQDTTVAGALQALNLNQPAGAAHIEINATVEAALLTLAVSLYAGTVDTANLITIEGALQALSLAQPAGGVYIEQAATVAGALQTLSINQPAGHATTTTLEGLLTATITAARPGVTITAQGPVVTITAVD
jgi:hypothetical protein